MSYSDQYVKTLEKYIDLQEKQLELIEQNKKLEETNADMRKNARALNKQVYDLNKQITENNTLADATKSNALWSIDMVKEDTIIKTMSGDEFIYICGTWRKLIKP